MCEKHILTTRARALIEILTCRGHKRWKRQAVWNLFDTGTQWDKEGFGVGLVGKRLVRNRRKAASSNGRLWIGIVDDARIGRRRQVAVVIDYFLLGFDTSRTPLGMGHAKSMACIGMAGSICPQAIEAAVKPKFAIHADEGWIDGHAVVTKALAMIPCHVVVHHIHASRHTGHSSTGGRVGDEPVGFHFGKHEDAVWLLP
jgi:hypothetical protein